MTLFLFLSGCCPSSKCLLKLVKDNLRKNKQGVNIMKKILLAFLLIISFVFAASRAIVPDGWKPYKDKLNRFQIALPNNFNETKLAADENFKEGLQLETYLGSDLYLVKVMVCKTKPANNIKLKTLTDRLVNAGLEPKEYISTGTVTLLKGLSAVDYTIMKNPIPDYSRNERFFIKGDVLYWLSVTHYFSDTQKDLTPLLSMSLKIN